MANKFDANKIKKLVRERFAKALINDALDVVKDEVTNRIDVNFQTEHDFKGDFGITYRRNRTVVDGSYRDTVDLGKMLEETTLRWKKKPDGGMGLYVSIDTSYAEYVMYGYMTKGGKRIPPRRAFLLGLSQAEFQGKLEREIEKLKKRYTRK